MEILGVLKQLDSQEVAEHGGMIWCTCCGNAGHTSKYCNHKELRGGNYFMPESMRAGENRKDVWTTRTILADKEMLLQLLKEILDRPQKLNDYFVGACSRCGRDGHDAGPHCNEVINDLNRQQKSIEQIRTQAKANYQNMMKKQFNNNNYQGGNNQQTAQKANPPQKPFNNGGNNQNSGNNAFNKNNGQRQGPNQPNRQGGNYNGGNNQNVKAGGGYNNNTGNNQGGNARNPNYQGNNPNRNDTQRVNQVTECEEQPGCSNQSCSNQGEEEVNMQEERNDHEDDPNQEETKNC